MQKSNKKFEPDYIIKDHLNLQNDQKGLLTLFSDPERSGVISFAKIRGYYVKFDNATGKLDPIVVDSMTGIKTQINLKGAMEYLQLQMQTVRLQHTQARKIA